MKKTEQSTDARRVRLEREVMPRFVWFGMYLGHSQILHANGDLTAWFHDANGGPGYLLRLWVGEWRAA